MAAVVLVLVAAVVAVVVVVVATAAAPGLPEDFTGRLAAANGTNCHFRHEDP